MNCRICRSNEGLPVNLNDCYLTILCPDHIDAWEVLDHPLKKELYDIERHLQVELALLHAIPRYTSESYYKFASERWNLVARLKAEAMDWVKAERGSFR